MSRMEELENNMLIEIRSMTYRVGSPKLVPYKDRYNYKGFTSMYGYSPEIANHIKNTNSTKGIGKFPVYSDTLFLDFDNNEAAANEFRDKLMDNNYSFTRYHSGGRSIHFHIPIVPMYSINTPKAQKEWVEKFIDGADLSIYRHGGIYRLPGTYHVNNPGHYKKELDGFMGNLLEIGLPVPKPVVMSSKGEDNPEFYYSIFGKLLHMSIGEGGRNPHMYKMGMAARSAGIEHIEALKLINMWNTDNCNPPKEEWEVAKLVDWIYSHG